MTVTDDSGDKYTDKRPTAKGNWREPHFHGPLAADELIKEAQTANPRTLFFDLKFNRARELMIYMEETKIWQDLLDECAERSGTEAGRTCSRLREIMDERIAYNNSNFNAALRPALTPGIPSVYENVVKKEEQNK